MQKASLTSIVSLPSLISILDVGASFAGEAPSYQPLLDQKQARLIGFEPNLEACEKLRRTYGPPHVFFPHFIGDGKDATFYETNWFATGSLFKPNRKLLEKFQNLHELVTLVAEHPVQTRRIDDIPDLGPVDFMKLDVQGAELMILQGAERTLKDVSAIQVEVEFLELYENQPLFADVDRYLRGQGFVFHTFMGFGSRCAKPMVFQNDINRGIRQTLWSDAVYLRDWTEPAQLTVDQILKMAVIAHDVFGSADIACALLGYFDSVFGTPLMEQYMAGLSSGALKP